MPSSRCYPKKAPKVDRLLNTLSDNLSRELIHYFENHTSTDTASLDAAVSHIDSRIPSSTPSELQSTLHHTHLPKLDQRGWLDYDVRTETINYHGHETAEQLLSEVTDVFTE